MKTWIIKIIVFFLFFIGICIQIFSHEIILTDSISVIDITNEMELLENGEKIEDIENILIPTMTEKFKKPVKFPSGEVRKNIIWVRFTINNQSLYNRKWLLEYGLDSLEKTLQVYLVEPDFTKQSTRNIPGIILYKESILNRNPTFILDIPTSTKRTVYVKVKPNNPIVLKFSLWRVKPYIQKERIIQFSLGLYFGIIILAILYNLFIYFSFKDLAYLYYILFILSLSFHQLLYFGLASELVPAIKGIENGLSSFLFLCASITGLLFSKQFLNFKKKLPKINKYIILIFIPFLFFTLLYLILRISVFMYLFYLLFMIVFIGIYCLAIFLLIKGYKPARIFILAVSILLFSVIIQLLPNLGIIPDFYLYIVDIGCIAMIILFSFAFIDKINIILKEKIQAQKQAIENLYNADKLKDQFLANTSHELKTPLNGIIGITESLIDGVAGPVSESIRNNLQLIFSSSRRLNTLISDILDFASLKKDKIELHRAPINLSPIVNDILTLFSQQGKAKGIIIINKIKDSTPAVYADENRVYQIFNNLVENAIKFTEKGSITINAKEKDTFIEISITDTGIGISKDKLDIIFNSFEQVDASISRMYGGTGLGLSITKTLIELHGGEIWVESKQKQETTFYFTLHKAPDGVQPQVSEKKRLFTTYLDKVGISLNTELKAASLDGKKPLILVVDDDPINVQILYNHLKLNNYEVEYVYSGKAAINAIENLNKKYDAVLLDVMMPEMSGFETCKKIRDIYPPNQLPILFITVKNTPSDIVQGLEAGGNDFLSKPISKTELLARLHTHLALKHLNNEIEETQREFILRVGTIAETRSQETANHVKRVAEYSAILGQKYGLSNEEVNLLKFASPMHDIGKVGIPDSILNKPGKLTTEEFERMKKHTEIGYEMIGLSDKKLLRLAGIIALTHHERWDGKGYPKGLVKKDTPIHGRITAVADVFDAVGSDRCYKKAWDLERIYKHFRENRGTLFDPDLIDIFFNNLSLFLTIRKKYKDS